MVFKIIVIWTCIVNIQYYWTQDPLMISVSHDYLDSRFLSIGENNLLGYHRHICL